MLRRDPCGRLLVKRTFDVSAALVALVIAAPVMGLVALAVRFRLGRPILFTQARPGLHGATFRLYKFRTMTLARDGRGVLLPDEQRMTKLGRALRATSLDELPELFNVLKGDMSLVGPRPLLCEYLPLYDEEQHRRHEVRPGLTGLAQVSGRNDLSWEDKFRLDAQYVDNRSLRLDLAIICKTLREVLRRRGVTERGHVTTTAFTGKAARPSIVHSEQSLSGRHDPRRPRAVD